MEEQYTNRIEAYLKQTLSEMEREEFEKDLKDDPELNRILQEHILAMNVIDKQVENELRVKFDDWKKEKKQYRIRSLTILLYSAASILLFVGLLFIFNSKPITGLELANSYYSLPDSPERTMGDNNQYWSIGIEAYNNKLFGEAIHEWKLINKPNPEVKYYLAHCYFCIEDYIKASSLFIELSKGSSVYNFSSDWFLTLAYLSSNNMSLFNEHIQRILDDNNHPYYLDAKELHVRVNNL